MSTYGQFCPIAKAMEVLDERWTLLVVRELLLGSRHFNELRRGNPKMSPALLSKRLRRLERAGVVRRRGRGRSQRLRADRERAGAARRSSRPSVPGVPGGSATSARRTSTRTCCCGTCGAPCPWSSGRGGARSSRSGSRTSRRRSSRWWICVTGDEVDVCDVDPGFEVDGDGAHLAAGDDRDLARRPRLVRRRCGPGGWRSRRPPRSPGRCRPGSASRCCRRCRARRDRGGSRMPGGRACRWSPLAWASTTWKG